jgi:hypothetical protein
VPTNNANQNPEGLPAVWRAVHKLEKDFSEHLANLNRPSFWSKVWVERNWVIPTALLVFGCLCSGIWWIGGLAFDHRFNSDLGPLSGDVHAVYGDVRQLAANVSDLQNQIAILRLSAIPTHELKNHVEELKRIKTTLSQTPKGTPDYWPTAFQVITLLSRAVSNPTVTKSSLIENVTGPPGSYAFNSGDFVLKGVVTGGVFRNSIIRVDPNARLANDRFENCVLVLPYVQNPSEPLQRIGNELLASSDLSNLSIGGL